MAEKKLSILVELKDQISGGLGILTQKFDALISQGNILNGVLGLAFGGAVAAGVGKLVEMFASEEEAIVKLNAALRISGLYSVEATTVIQQMAQKMQDQTTTSRDQAIEISSRFAALARNLTADQLAEAQRMVIGFAAATGKSVDEATSLMVRAVTTHVTHVRGLSVELDANATQQQRFATLMGATDKLFAIAAEDAQTLGGQIKQAQNAFGDLERTMGEVIVKALGLDTGAGALRDKIKDMTSWLVQNSGEFIKWGRVLVDVLKMVWDGFVNGVRVVEDVVKILFNSGKTIGDGLILGGAWVQAKIVDLINWFVDRLNDVILLIPKTIRDKLDLTPVGHVANTAAEYVADAKKNIVQDAAAVGAAFDDLAKGSSDAFDRIRKAWLQLQKDLSSKPGNVKPVGGVSTAGGGANTGDASTDSDPTDFARQMRAAADNAKASFEAGLTTLDQYRKTLNDIRKEIEAHIGGLDKTSTAYAELAKVLKQINSEDPFRAQLKTMQDDMPKALVDMVLAHQSFSAAIKKEIGKAAASYAELDFAHAIEELAGALASLAIYDVTAAGHHFASAAQYEIGRAHV